MTDSQCVAIITAIIIGQVRELPDYVIRGTLRDARRILDAAQDDPE